MDHEHNQRQLERLSFFSDAVFAIAMTLLVVEIHLPEAERWDDPALAQALIELIPHYAGFLSSFLVIGRFWISHHQLFGYLRSSSGRLVWANLLLLLGIAFLPFSTAVFSAHATLRVAVGLYAGWFCLVGLANWNLVRVALADDTLVRPDVSERDQRARRHGAWIAPIISALAFAAGMITPLLAIAALAIGSPIVIALVRRMDRPEPEPAAAG